MTNDRTIRPTNRWIENNVLSQNETKNNFCELIKRSRDSFKYVNVSNVYWNKCVMLSSRSRMVVKQTHQYISWSIWRLVQEIGAYTIIMQMELVHNAKSECIHHGILNSRWLSTIVMGNKTAWTHHNHVQRWKRIK